MVPQTEDYEVPTASRSLKPALRLESPGSRCTSPPIGKVFGRFGLNGGEIGAVRAFGNCVTQAAGLRHPIAQGVDALVGRHHQRLDRLERRGHVKRTRHPVDAEACWWSCRTRAADVA
jgi:hypothetical protein